MTDQFAGNPTNLPTATGECELQELVGIINAELTAGLRGQSDTNPRIETDGKRKDIGRHICIELAGKQIAIPLAAVQEAGELQLVQPLPLLPAWLTGITNIRGEIVSVVNLALFLDLKNSSSANARSFLIVHDDILKVAITVDRIIGTRSLYRSLPGQSEQSLDTDVPVAFFSGKALYEEENSEKELHLFDLDTFLSSHKLQDIASA